jgi:hypothetical protein
VDADDLGVAGPRAAARARHRAHPLAAQAAAPPARAGARPRPRCAPPGLRPHLRSHREPLLEALAAELTRLAGDAGAGGRLRRDQGAGAPVGDVPGARRPRADPGRGQGPRRAAPQAPPAPARDPGAGGVRARTRRLAVVGRSCLETPAHLRADGGRADPVGLPVARRRGRFGRRPGARHRGDQRRAMALGTRRLPPAAVAVAGEGRARAARQRVEAGAGVGAAPVAVRAVRRLPRGGGRRARRGRRRTGLDGGLRSPTC